MHCLSGLFCMSHSTLNGVIRQKKTYECSYLFNPFFGSRGIKLTFAQCVSQSAKLNLQKKYMKKRPWRVLNLSIFFFLVSVCVGSSRFYYTHSLHSKAALLCFGISIPFQRGSFVNYSQPRSFAKRGPDKVSPIQSAMEKL